MVLGLTVAFVVVAVVLIFSVIAYLVNKLNHS
jgi:hypothetical protein